MRQKGDKERILILKINKKLILGTIMSIFSNWLFRKASFFLLHK